MLIKLKVKTGQKKYKLEKKADDSFEVFVKEKPERGLANEAVLQLVSSYFKRQVGKVRIVRGGKSPHKIVELE